MSAQESIDRTQQSSQHEIAEVQSSSPPVMSQLLLAHEETVLAIDSGSQLSTRPQVENNDNDLSAPVDMSQVQSQQSS